MQLKSEDWASEPGDLIWANPLSLKSAHLIQMTTAEFTLIGFTAHYLSKQLMHGPEWTQVI